jgi:hypothetical protein
MLVRDGNAPCCRSATDNISAKAQTCENAVSTKALARREPYPPAKSDVPHKNTAVTLHAAGANWAREDTPDEGNMLPQMDGRSGNWTLATVASVLEFPQAVSLRKHRF